VIASAAEDHRDGCNISTWPHDNLSHNHLVDFFSTMKSKWYIPLPEIYDIHASDGASRMKPADWESKLKGAIVRIDFELYFRKLHAGGKNVFSPKLSLLQVLQKPYTPNTDVPILLQGPKGCASPKKKRRLDNDE
jgi:hypothetical protein